MKKSSAALLLCFLSISQNYALQSLKQLIQLEKEENQEYLDTENMTNTKLNSLEELSMTEITHLYNEDVSGKADTRYSGRQTIQTSLYPDLGGYVLHDNTRGQGIFTYKSTSAGYSDYIDQDNNWDSDEYDNSDHDIMALDVHFGSQATYDYWLETFGRNSYDGEGGIIINYIDQEFTFADWSSPNDATYGIRSKKGISIPMTDVSSVGRVLGHALCSYTANLSQEDESGAIGECLSNIWGACISHYVNQRYGLELDVWVSGDPNYPYRTLSNPKNHNQPDTYMGKNWFDGYSNFGQNIFTNSGVGNYWFYLLVEGGFGVNDNGDAYAINGIDFPAAEAIVYRTETVYLTRSSNYQDFRLYSIQAARDLFGEGSTEEIMVTNAWHAVGVGETYPSECSLNALKGLTVTNITGTQFTLSWNPVANAEFYGVTIGDYNAFVSEPEHTAGYFSSNQSYTAKVTAFCGEGETGASSTIEVETVDMFPQEQDYCVRSFGNGDNHYIESVKFNNISYISKGSYSGPGYQDNTDLYTLVVKDFSYSLEIEHGRLGVDDGFLTYLVYWIDWNGDGDFDDESEFYEVEPDDQTLLTEYNYLSRQNIYIPISAESGPVVMRIMCIFTKEGAVPGSMGPCVVRAEGDPGYSIDVEDYTLIITEPWAPYNLEVFDVTKNGFELSWDVPENAIAKTFEIEINDEPYITTSSRFWSFDQLHPGTTYKIAVRAILDDGQKTKASTIVVSTLCQSSAKANSTMYIDQVRVRTGNSINIMDNNRSGKSQTGYSDYTALDLAMFPGDEYLLRIKKKTDTNTQALQNMGYASWIDFNGNGSFDPSEQIILPNPGANDGNGIVTSNGIVNKSFTVPADLKSGYVNMRVSMNLHTVPGPCSQLAYGEVEDYKVLILSEEDILPPSAIDVSNITSNSAEITWEPVKHASNYHIYLNGKFYGSSTSNSYVLSNLEPLTLYAIEVRAVYGVNHESESVSTQFETLDSYCSVSPSDHNYYWIKKFKLKTIKNQAGQERLGKNGYHFNKDMSTTLRPGLSYFVELSAGDITFEYTPGHFNFAVYIDYNNDNDFDDENEEAYKVRHGSAYSSGSITIPPGIPLGWVRMRVVMTIGSNPTSCGELDGAGEIQDYMINITDYCAANGKYKGNVWIQNFSLDGIENLKSGCSPNGYGDFTDMWSIAMVPGGTYDLLLKPKFKTTWYQLNKASYSVFVDANQDYDFNDDGELIYQGTTPPRQITIPPSAKTGATRFRVIVNYRYFASYDPCPQGFNGEVEDYTIRLLKPQAGLRENFAENVDQEIEVSDTEHMKIYPNPVGDRMYINYSGDINSISILGIDGRKLEDTRYMEDHKSIDVSSLKPGIYIIQALSSVGVLQKAKFIKQ